jgi:hypothetical protein
MRLSAVFTCVRIRSEDMGKLPCILYRRMGDGGKERATDHSLFSLLRQAPNPYQTAMEFKQLLQAWVDLRGNGYALKEVDARGRVTALWPLNPAWVTVLRVPETFELFYRVSIPRKKPMTYPAEAILHLRGMSLDGFIGLSPIAYHRETIGLGSRRSATARRSSATLRSPAARSRCRMFSTRPPPICCARNGSRNTRASTTREARDLRRRDGVGPDRHGQHRRAIPRDAQIPEPANLWALSHAGAQGRRSGKGDLNNIEQQSLEYVTDCLLSEMVRWEQTLCARSVERGRAQESTSSNSCPTCCCAAISRAAMRLTRSARNWGLLSANECRDRENMNRYPNGDAYLQPLNMSEAGTKPPPVSTPAPGGAKYLLQLAQTLVAQEDERGKYLNGNGRIIMPDCLAMQGRWV